MDIIAKKRELIVEALAYLKTFDPASAIPTMGLCFQVNQHLSNLDITYMDDEYPSNDIDGYKILQDAFEAMGLDKHYPVNDGDLYAYESIRNKWEGEQLTARLELIDKLIAHWEGELS